MRSKVGSIINVVVYKQRFIASIGLSISAYITNKNDMMFTILENHLIYYIKSIYY